VTGDGSATVVVSDQQSDVNLITVVNEATWAPGTFLISKSTMSGSRVYDGISDAMEYCLSDPRLRKSSRLALLVCSDMEDTSPDRDKAEERLVSNLKDFGKHGGVVGMYWVRTQQPNLVSVWRRHLDEAGVTGVVEGDIRIIDMKTYPSRGAEPMREAAE